MRGPVYCLMSENRRGIEVSLMGACAIAFYVFNGCEEITWKILDMQQCY